MVSVLLVCASAGKAADGPANHPSLDHTYRDTLVTCDKKNDSDVLGTLPSCPNKPMPMLDTPKKSYTRDYSPYLFAYPRDLTATRPEDKARPYAGDYSVGTMGDASRTFQMFGKGTKGAKQTAACSILFKAPDSFASADEEAKFNRLQLDACTNQYILSWALAPFQKEIPAEIDPEKPGELLSLQTQCQPLKTFEKDDDEYDAAPYLEAAWKKTLQDPSHRKTIKGFNNVPCLSDSMPCDREPHLPSGVQIEKQADLPDPFPEEVKLSAIGAVKYEEINDPTHPFSPRWDYQINDRQYASPDARSLGSGLGRAIKIYGQHQTYMSDPKDTIFCAGVKNADKESSEEDKKDAQVRVDVLEFRRGAFESALDRRTNFNWTCFNHRARFTSGNDYLPYVIAGSYCYTVTRCDYTGCYGKDYDCWECFGLKSGQQVDDENEHPPCTTNYLGKDLKIVSGKSPGMLNLGRRSAQCNYFLSKRDSKYNMDKVCADLRRPVTMINKLKMRYHRTDDKDDRDGNNNVLKEGALEGLTFKEYFGNRMPYPRLWDTSASLQKSPTKDRNSQPPKDTTGQYTAIVGVGREAPAGGSSSSSTQPTYDERCKTMGWGKPAGAAANFNLSFGTYSVQVPDPITSWTEMKLYQTRTQRLKGMSCLGRYEKVFKPGSAENMMMKVTGVDWSRMVIKKCKPEKSGALKDCTDLSLQDYIKAGSPKDDATTAYTFQTINANLVNGWRGYLASSIEGGKFTFPKFGGSPASGTMLKGLDKAELGDIILMPYGPKNDRSKPGLAKFALVIDTNINTQKPGEQNCYELNNCFVKVFEPDNGKFPDICGTTDTWNEMKARTYYRTGKLPKEAKEEYQRIKVSGNCEETRINRCEMSAWDDLSIYRIRDDKRTACDKLKAIDCKD